MSEGPIKRERDAHKPKAYSQTGNKRVCAESAGHAYCGRKNERRATSWGAVNCNDCRAAHNADERRQAHELLEVKR